MGVVVDFDDGLHAMLDELEETYDGRILSPQGKIIRVMPLAMRSMDNGDSWAFHGHVYVTTLIHGEIYQALLATAPISGDGDHEEKWQETREELKKLTAEIEREISGRGFIIRRGRYLFKGEEPHTVD